MVIVVLSPMRNKTIEIGVDYSLVSKCLVWDFHF